MSDPIETLNVRATEVKTACEKLCDTFGIPINYRVHCLDHPELENSAVGPRLTLWQDVEAFSRQIIRNAWGGGSDASPFKIVAAVSIAIVSMAPIEEFFPEDLIKERDLREILKFPFAPASLIALHFSLRVLHNSTVGERNKPLSTPISLSEHYHDDAMIALALIAAQMKGLSRGEKVSASKVPFSLLTLIYEALAYKANDGVENKEKIVFERI